MERSCPVCGNPMEGKRATAKTCSPACKKRAQRDPAVLLAAAPDPAADAGTGSGTPDLAALQFGVSLAVHAELTAASRLDTTLGQAALKLALRIDSARDTGSALASLTKELRATLAEATKGAATAETELDRMRRTREARLA